MSENSENKGPLIAIDGPAGCGKSTLTNKLSAYFSIPALNTGGLYRAVAIKVLDSDTVPEDEEKVALLASQITPDDLKSDRLHDEEVGAVASKVAVLQKVRDALLKFQRDFAHNPKGAVLEGRDIGTVICPDADYKFYMTATPEIRAERRYKQLLEKGSPADYDKILQQIKDRDFRDSNRANSPMMKAEDAFEIDTSNINIDEVFQKVLSFIKYK